MGLSRVESQILWSSANTITTSVTTKVSSDEYVFDATDVACAVQIRANLDGTPASTDVLNVYARYSVGDLDAGGGSNDFDTDDHLQFLCQLNTYLDDPATKTVPIDVSAKSFQLVIEAPADAASHHIIVHARKIVTRAS